VIKYACIWNKAFFLLLCGNTSREKIMERIEMILCTCCGIKAQVVEEDEQDHGARMILNFGHTLGHAFERAGGYEDYTHGQAVAAGMCAAVKIGQQMGVSLCDDYEALEILLGAFGLPGRIACDRDTVAEAIGLDKKGDGDEITLILLQKIGTAVAKKVEKTFLLQLLESVCGR
jgi:3-dehydroquinate synthase